MPKSPPFQRRLAAAIAAAKTAGATHIKVNSDGSVELDFNANHDVPINDFDRPPNPPRSKIIKRDANV